MMSSSLPGVPTNTFAPCVVNLATSAATSLHKEQHCKGYVSLSIPVVQLGSAECVSWLAFQ